MPFRPAVPLRSLCRLFLAAAGAAAPAGLPGQAVPDESVFDRTLHVDAAASGGLETGSADAPFSTLGAAFAEIGQHPDERIRVLASPGTYREGGLTLQDRAALLVIEPAEPGAIIVSGSDIWTDWTVDGGHWVTHWPHKWGLAPVEANMPVSEAGRRGELVFVDGVLYRQVVAAADLIPGSFFVDEAAEEIRVLSLPGDDPQEALVEVGIRRNLLSLRRVSNFVLRGMVFQHSVSGGMHSGDEQRTVIITGQGDGGAETVFGHEGRAFNESFLIEDCAFEWNNATGLTLANARLFTLRNTRFRHNGRSGLGTNRAQHVVWEGLVFEGNNWRLGLLGGAYGWDPAGVKLLRYDDLRISDSVFRGNYASGLWIDHGNTNITARRIRSTHNWKHGVYYEANVGPFLLEDSLVRDNAFPLRGDLWDGGVFLAESTNTGIRRSFIIHNNYFALGTRNRERFSTMYWTGETHTGEVSNISLHDSVIVGARTEPNLKEFPSNFSDNHFNGGAIVAHTQTPEATRNWFSLYSAGTYTGSGNRFFHAHTERVFSRPQNTGFGFNRLTLEEWAGATAQDLDSTVDPVWEEHLADDAFIEANGLIVFEAEDTTTLRTAGDPYPWGVRHGLHSGRIGHGGWGYLAPSELPPHDPGQTSRGTAAYRLRVSTEGTYTLAFRYWSDAPNASPDLRLNGNALPPADPLPATNDRWRWGHGTEVTLSPGTHIVTIERPEAGFALDRVLLALDPTALPPAGSTGTGPPESETGMPSMESADPFLTWLRSYFTESQLADDSLHADLWGPKADPDQDGIPNLLEFVLGGNPLTPGTAMRPTVDTVIENGDRHLRLSVSRNPDAATVALTVETASLLEFNAWAAGDDHTVVETANGNLLRIRDAVPLAPGEPRFIRLSAKIED